MKSQSSGLRTDASIDLHINHWIKGRMNMIGAKEDALLFKEKSTIMNESSCVSEGEVSAQISVRSYENDTFELEEQPQKSPLQCLESRKVLDLNHIYSDSESDEKEIDSGSQSYSKLDFRSLSTVASKGILVNKIDCVICNAPADNTTLESLNSSENEKFCCECRKIDSVPIILGSRMEENWRGLIMGKQSPMKKKSRVKTEKRIMLDKKREDKENDKPQKSQRTKTGKISRYLDRNQKTFDALSNENLSKIPVLKNGSSGTLEVNIILELITFF